MNKQVSTIVYPLSMYAGDLNTDNVINISDIMLIATAFNSSPEDPRYIPELDLNVDNAINIKDIMIVARNFNKIALD